MIKTIGKYLLVLFVLIGSFAADFGSKKWAQKNLRNAPQVSAVKGFMELGFAENRGMVFGMLNHSRPTIVQKVLTVVRAIILVGVLIFIGLNITKPFLFLFPFVLLVSGASGNLYDTLFYGYVVDFIHIHLGNILDWPFFFNIADVYVLAGVVLLLFTGAGFSKKTV